jgi:hypothetical protein
MFDTGNRVEGLIFPQRASLHLVTPDFWEDAVLILDGME